MYIMKINILKILLPIFQIYDRLIGRSKLSIELIALFGSINFKGVFLGHYILNVLLFSFYMNEAVEVKTQEKNRERRSEDW